MAVVNRVDVSIISIVICSSVEGLALYVEEIDPGVVNRNFVELGILVVEPLFVVKLGLYVVALGVYVV